MGVSFKVSKVGRRYQSDMLQVVDEDRKNGTSNEPHLKENEADAIGEEDNVADHSNVFAKLRVSPQVSEDLEVSFSVNLFTNGFSFGKATELFNYAPQLLHPYDKASEKLFSAIECGCLPGDLFDDIHCKYVNGAILCEIRDYRICFAYTVNVASSASDYPTIHKVLLHMGIENVVKDISSISNNSWTYEDQLKVESGILKALQPGLRLNPKPVLGRLCEETMAKKLDLRIPWSWKKRKLSGAPTTEVPFSNPFNGTYVPGFSLDQNFKSQFNLAFQDRGVTCTRRIIPSSSSNSQDDNIVQEKMLQSIPLSSLSNHQVMLSSTRTIPAALTLSKIVSAPKQCYSDSAETGKFIFGSRSSCNMQEMRGPTHSKPKGELLDFSQPQSLRSQVETIHAPHLQLRSKLAQQRFEAEKSIPERLNGNKNPSLILDKGQQEILAYLPTLLAGIPTCNMRQALAETSDVPNLDIGNNGDNLLLRDMRSNQSIVQQLKLQFSSPSSRVTVPPSSIQANQVDQPVGHNMIGGTVSQKRKASQNHQVFTVDESTPVSSSLSKRLNLKVGGSTSTNNMNEVNEKSPPEEDSCLPQHSGSERDPVLGRFSNISMVAQRYGLIHRKDQSNNFLGRRQFSSVNPLVGFNLLIPRNIETSKDAITDGLSKCFLDQSPDVSRTRTLTFIRPPRDNQGNTIALIDNGDQKKLIIAERLNEGMIEASVLYGHEEYMDSIDFPFPPTIPSAQYADVFATQFTSLMVCEGYQLSRDQIEPTPIGTDGGSSSQQPSPTSSAIPIAGTVEVTTRALMSFPSSQIISPTSSSMSSLDLRQSLSQNFLSGDHVLPVGNTQSDLKLSADQLSKPETNTAAQLTSVEQHWPHIFKNHALLQSQVQQRQRPPQLLQRKLIMGGFGVSEGSLGTIQLGGGIQEIANIGLGSFNEASTSLSVGGHISGIGNMVNNLGNNITSFNGSKQLFDGFTDPLAAVLAGQERVMRNGVLIQGDAAPVMLMQRSNILDMAFNLPNQELPQQPLELGSLVEHMSSPPSQLRPLKFGQQPQLNLQQLSTGYALSQQQISGENVLFGPESLELSSQTHGSVNSGNAGSVGYQSG